MRFENEREGKKWLLEKKKRDVEKLDLERNKLLRRIIALEIELKKGKEEEAMDYNEIVKNKEKDFYHRYIYKGDKNSDKIGVVALSKEGRGVGWSFCNEKDSFCKNKGKTIAFLRAESNKSTLEKIPKKWEAYIPQIEDKVDKLKSLRIK